MDTNTNSSVSGLEGATQVLREFPDLIKYMTALLDVQKARNASDFRWLRMNLRELKVELTLFEDSIRRLWGERRSWDYGYDGYNGYDGNGGINGDTKCWRESGVDFMTAKHTGDGNSGALLSNE